jgi:general stress protein 26
MANSINREQPEENRADIAGADAVQRIRDVVEKTATCFFCTAVTTGGSGAARPMSVQKVDKRGHLWFLAASDSHTVAELAVQGDVRLFFQGSEHANFLTLTGQATVGQDKAKIHALWEPILKTWFTEGEDDPRVRTIEFVPAGGYYWDNKHGSMVAGIKMLVGAAIGKTLDDSIEGTLAFR